MPERAINPRNATGFLLILLPAAIALSALYEAWPFILGMTLLIAGGNLWQNYKWSKMVQSINPVFQQLVIRNRGEISSIDLSLFANISGTEAQRYLVTKSNEFGTGSREYPDRGQVYYFVSFSTLGSILDDSERDLPEIPAAIVSAPAILGSQPEPTAPVVAELVQIPLPVESLLEETTSQPQANLRELFDSDPPPPEVVASVEVHLSPQIDRPIVTIIQSELAKRLDVHSSTIYKRRSEPNFTDWTRNRDPDGLAWFYGEDTKEYYRML